ncbi:cupin domain-containing protein [Nesterenkonia sp. YGD6]|uniref:helix-turn-helix domain-containing protein n=1 Tax=Nesterenkonia sp. YGD6 TaxID=2901231 RepID=UPI001F4D1640|nr:cupin domain-containing protein [Nesterenkonia sp. YGD6]MCH8563672.1 cupin domain-containing protein [Nesterenkonia sp. YGD6]
MESNKDSLSAAIGVRVRHERLGRGWTLDELAEASSVSRRMLINVEQGTANPSVGILLKLSDALDVGLPVLVAPPNPSGTRITRNGDGAVLWSGDHGGQGVLVASVDSPNVLDMWDWSLHPQEEHSSAAHTPGTKELLQVLEGSIVVDVGGELQELATGDALVFPGDVPHAYMNPHPHPARFTLTVFEPGRTPAHREKDTHA